MAKKKSTKSTGIKRTSRNTAANQAAVLAAYAESGNLRVALEAAGVPRATHFTWLKNDDYVARFDQAREEATELLEQEARRRAFEGCRSIKFHQGEAIIDPDTGEPYREMNYSDTLLIFLLKAMRPETYRERSQVDMNATVENTGSVSIYLPSNGRDDKQLTDETDSTA